MRICKIFDLPKGYATESRTLQPDVLLRVEPFSPMGIVRNSMTYCP